MFGLGMEIPYVPRVACQLIEIADSCDCGGAFMLLHLSTIYDSYPFTPSGFSSDFYR